MYTREKRPDLVGILKAELTGLGDGMNEEPAGSRLWVDRGVAGPGHLVMER